MPEKADCQTQMRVELVDNDRMGHVVTVTEH